MAPAAAQSTTVSPTHEAMTSAFRGDEDRRGTIKRLLASKAAYESSHYPAGVGVGQQWAKETAEWSQLVALQRVFGDWDEARWKSCAGDENNPIEMWFVEVIWEGEDNPTYDRTSAWWLERCGLKSPAWDFIWGFCQGALEVWKAVEPDIRRTSGTQ